MKKLSFEEFKIKAIKTHGDKYDYSNVNYINSQTKVEIKCPIHGVFFQKPNNHFTRGCFKCKANKIKSTKLIKYGNENFNNIEKIKNTNIKKYGTSTPLINDAIKQKTKNTIIERYGVDNVFKSDVIKQKTKNTIIERYGVDNVSKNDIVKLKLSEKAKKRDKGCYMKSINKKRNLFIEDLQSKIGDDYKILRYNSYYDVEVLNKISMSITNESVYTLTRRSKLGLDLTVKNNSNLQNEVLNFTKSFGCVCIENDRKTIHPLELDIYIPSRKLAIEFNGFYWHDERNKPNDYHLNKTNLCEAKGIHLIHIYEDDWLYKQDIVKSRLKSIFGLSENRFSARKCIIKELDNNTAKTFLNENHLYGSTNAKYRYGLFFENELVACMTFGFNRFEKNKIELHRFANKLGSNVIGGASRLFKHFLNIVKPTEVISYADRSWTMNNGKSVYEQLGFKLDKKTSPGYSYAIKGHRENRFKFRKSELIKEGFDSNKTEVEIMNERGFYRIFDSGNLKFCYEVV